MKNYVVLIICIQLVLLSVLSIFAADQRVVRVGAFNYYPGIFKDVDGTVKGFYVDALADIAQRENIRFEYVYGSWSEGLERIKNGEVDVLTSVAFSPERAEFLDYAKTPLLTVWGELYAPLGSEIDGIRAVQGKKIAVMKGDINARHFIELIKKFDITCEFVEVTGFDDVFKAVAEKTVDAGVVNSTFGVARQKKYGLRATGIVFNPFDIFFAVVKGKNNNLLVLLDTYLDNWKHQENSPYNIARQKWSHAGNGAVQIIPRWLVASVALLALFALSAFAFIVVLKKQVRSKTRSVIESAQQYKMVSERQNAILAAVPDIIMEVDKNKVYTWSNTAGLEFFGEDVLGKEASYYFAGDQNTHDVVQPLFEGINNTQYVESWQRRKDGEVRILAWWCKTLVDEDGSVTGTLSAARDITEIKRAEDEKEAANIRFKNVMDSLDALVYVADMETHELLFINEYGKKMFGNVEGKICWQTLQLGQSGPCVYCTNNRLLLENGQPADVYVWEFKNTVIDHWFECRDKAILWHDKRIVRMEIATDITDRKHAEEALRLTRISIEHASDSLFWITPDAHITDINNAACLSLGYSREELLQLSVQDVDVHYNSEKWPQHFTELRQHGSLKFESEQRAKDGRLIPVEIVANYVRLGELEFDCAFVRDISERKRIEADSIKLEGQLHHMQKIESVGNLAGGVAHDFNNKLSVILGYTYLALAESDSSVIRKHLEEIRKASEQSADLTRQLLTFARKQTISPKVINLNDTVSGLLKMLHRLIGEQIHLSWQPAADLWPVKLDPTQFDQILANLIVNARDSIIDVGKITIETSNVIIDQNYASQDADAQPGEYVTLTVSDTGCGMDKETIDHIFEPFFTTKGVGEGTGLGLATVFGAIKQHKGFINVYSELGLGTKFTIYILRHVGDIELPERHDNASSTPRGLETILLVEDELAILNMAAMILTNQGYKVLQANSPIEGIRVAEEHIGKIHLLITDVIMPEMNGRDLASTLQSLNPQLKCLFMSGYTADAISRHGVLDENVHFIQKPFSLPAIASKVREVLDWK